MIVFVVDDEAPLRKIIKIILEKSGYLVYDFENPVLALKYIEKINPDVIISDFKMPEMNGEEFLDAVVSQNYKNIYFVLMTAFATVKGAVPIMKKGAYDYLIKPFSDDEILFLMNKIKKIKNLEVENRSLKNELIKKNSLESIIGCSDEINKIYKLIDKVANVNTCVLITGESGTGKELVANLIHYLSNRKRNKFLAINCAAISGELLESELFGYKKGAFTGALSDREGYFKAAENGTLFLDEIGEMDIKLQSKLLRVLDNGEYLRIGDTVPKKSNCRIIAATNKNLALEVEKGNFRKDLFYRLEVVKINIPNLSERISDIPLLVKHFVEKSNGVKKIEISNEFLNGLKNYSWPGNIRELKNVIESACIFCESGCLEFSDLPDKIKEVSYKDKIIESFDYNLSFKDFKQISILKIEKKYLENILTKTSGNISKAAQKASMDRRNFQKILKKHNINVDKYKDN